VSVASFLWLKVPKYRLCDERCIVPVGAVEITTVKKSDSVVGLRREIAEELDEAVLIVNFQLRTRTHSDYEDSLASSNWMMLAAMDRGRKTRKDEGACSHDMPRFSRSFSSSRSPPALTAMFLQVAVLAHLRPLHHHREPWPPGKTS
jgi:hypothetical protein